MLAAYSNSWQSDLTFIDAGVAFIGLVVLIVVTWILIRGYDRLEYRRYWWPWRFLILIAVILLAWSNLKAVGSACHGVCG